MASGKVKDMTTNAGSGTQTVKYRITRWSTKIIPVICVRETDKTVIILDDRGRERRHLKAPEYFDTWEAARDALLERSEGEVRSLKSRLSQAEGALGNIKGLRPPKLESEIQ